MIDSTATGWHSISRGVKTNLILSRDLHIRLLYVLYTVTLIFMCVQKLFAVMISLTLAVLHQNKSLLIIAVFYLDASQTRRDYGIECVFFSTDFIGRVFSELSHFITRPEWPGKNRNDNYVVHELALLCLETSVVCLV